MKKFVKRISIALGCCFLLVVFFFKIEEISSAIINFKVAIFSLLPQESPLSPVDFTQYEPLVDEENGWYTENLLIAHACGGIDGRDYTNSKEAMEKAISDAHRVIEIDFDLTSDEKIVCHHSYERATVYEEFMATPIQYLYTAMDIEDVFQYMLEHEDIYVVTDMKGNAEYPIDVIQRIVNLAKEKGYEKLLNRFIIQIYYEQDYAKIQNIYPFKNIIYTLYTSGTQDFTRVVEYSVQNNIHVVTMPSGAATEEVIKYFKDMNVKLYVHTVNDMDELIRLHELGVDGFYTDFIRPNDLKVIGLDKTQ